MDNTVNFFNSRLVSSRRSTRKDPPRVRDLRDPLPRRASRRTKRLKKSPKVNNNKNKPNKSKKVLKAKEANTKETEAATEVATTRAAAEAATRVETSKPLNPRSALKISPPSPEQFSLR